MQDKVEFINKWIKSNGGEVFSFQDGNVIMIGTQKQINVNLLAGMLTGRMMIDRHRAVMLLTSFMRNATSLKLTRASHLETADKYILLTGNDLKVLSMNNPIF